MNNNELKIVVPNGRNFTAKENIFKLVRASELRLSDDFLKYTPNTPHEEEFKEAVEKVIKAGVQDFYRPTLDPSFDSDGQICYQAGMKPAVGKSYNWWAKEAKNFCPERKSRLGTYSEYIAFLAVLIKELVDAGKSLEWAWTAVCFDSEELGHYWDFSDATYKFEVTGNREVCGWSDLANTYKILAENEETGGFWLASGCCNFVSFDAPLARLYRRGSRYDGHRCGAGWLVLS